MIITIIITVIVIIMLSCHHHHAIIITIIVIIITTTIVYNDHGGTEADFYWSSGYLTLQNFVDNYLAQQYDGNQDFDVSVLW